VFEWTSGRRFLIILEVKGLVGRSVSKRYCVGPPAEIFPALVMRGCFTLYGNRPEEVHCLSRESGNTFKADKSE